VREDHDNEDAGPRLPEPGGRQWFLFAMKDPLPLGPEGWSVAVHQPDCGDDHGNLCLTDARPCAGTHVYFLGFPHEHNSLTLATTDLLAAMNMLTERDRDPAAEPIFDALIDPPGMYRWIAAASTAVTPDEKVGDVFHRSFDLIADAVAALRNATGAGIPDPTIERMHPWYLTAHEHLDGEIEATGLVRVEHVWFGPPPPATPEQLNLAQHFLLHRWRRNPVEAYRTLSLQARIAVNHDGDYMKALLTAAIACEVLIKNAAWMLTFEASRMASDPTPTTTVSGLGALKPSQLIGRVLQPRLGGNWISNDPGEPVGAWRHHIARVRSEALHRGRRPTALEADEALLALRALERHIADRTAASGTTYPRTAYIQVGPDALDRRGLLTPVVNALADAPEEPEDFVAGYVAWLDTVLDQVEADS
jgi:hypothetical protein